MMEWPSINAALNFTSATLLILGYYFVKKKAYQAHVFCMLTACGTSVLFLASYLYYHYHHGSTPYQGQGLKRLIYFSILISHSILAVVIVPMVIQTLYRAFRSQLPNHVRIARKTLPLWLYVSVTGVVIYWMLYQMQP